MLLPCTQPFAVDLCDYVLDEVKIGEEQIVMTLRAPHPLPAEQLQIACTDATLLTEDNTLRQMFAKPDWQRTIDDVLILDKNTLYVALLSGPGLLIQSPDIHLVEP